MALQWDDFIYNAKSQLGYGEDEYIEDWDEVVCLAHDLKRVEYEVYMESEKWQIVRKCVFKRDNNICQICLKERCNECHHKNYDYFGHCSNLEVDSCVGLCTDCHKQLHKDQEMDLWHRVLLCSFCGRPIGKTKTKVSRGNAIDMSNLKRLPGAITPCHCGCSNGNYKYIDDIKWAALQ